MRGHLPSSPSRLAQHGHVPAEAKRIPPVSGLRVVSGVGLVLALTDWAAGERLPIRVRTTADGPAHDRVTCIIADFPGFLGSAGKKA
jgi:hypothetical protein